MPIYGPGSLGNIRNSLKETHRPTVPLPPNDLGVGPNALSLQGQPLYLNGIPLTIGS